VNLQSEQDSIVMNFLHGKAKEVASLLYFIDQSFLSEISYSIRRQTNKYSMRRNLNLLGTGDEYVFWYQVLS